MSEVIDVEIDQIKIDVDEIQPREKLEEGPLALFREMYKEYGPEALPAIVVYHDADDVFWLADGHYRYHAACDALSSNGPRTLPAIVHEGTKRDAFIYAAGANKHGTHLTNAEKRRVVIRLLKDAEWQKMSDNTIARHVGVSNGFVSSIHRDLVSQAQSLLKAKIPPPRTTTYVRNGKEITIRSDKIGRATKSKAKTTTPTTVLDNSTEAPEKPHTDVATERNVDDNQDASTNSATPTIAPIHEEHPIAENADPPTEDDQEQNQETDTSPVIGDLKVAWSQTTHAERMSFLQWIIHHETGEINKKAVEAFSVLVEQSNEEMR